MGLLERKIAVITGAGRGIGRAVAIAMAGEGATVGVMARTQKEIENVADEIKLKGGQCIAIAADVGCKNDIDHFFTIIHKKLGEVDILVNNAAIAKPLGYLWETDPEEWLNVFNINVVGMARCTRAVLPAMIKKRSGKIIIVGSHAAWSDNWAINCCEQMVYGISKAAVKRFSEILTEQVKNYGINVNCIGVEADTTLGQDAFQALAKLRGDITSNKIKYKPVEKMIMPEENVAPFIFLSSSLSDHITGVYIEANKMPENIRKFEENISGK